MIALFKSKRKTGRGRILIVDDESNLVDIVQSKLESYKYEVITATNGEQGLKKAAKEKPDLILLDVNMPVMNGREMLEKLRKNPDLKDMPVIMCTVVSEPQDIAAISSYGLADYIIKPFDFTELMERIANAL